jgi:ElaB/YqjD/DUF883 family membrane-anchored ribosome-binding protein
MEESMTDIVKAVNRFSKTAMSNINRVGERLKKTQKENERLQAEIAELNGRIFHNDMFKATGGVLAKTELCNIIGRKQADLDKKNKLLAEKDKQIAKLVDMLEEMLYSNSTKYRGKAEALIAKHREK